MHLVGLLAVSSLDPTLSGETSAEDIDETSVPSSLDPALSGEASAEDIEAIVRMTTAFPSS